MNEKRNVQIHFRLTPSEAERLRTKMKEAGIQSQGAYFRKMALDGYCVRLDLEDVREMVSLLRRCSNNLNQYARRANETGSIYLADLNDLQERMQQLWQLAREILVQLSSI